ncbi:1160_t:CDS:2 [Dentiscutata heterogama]|uniref:1160_t:CDS:1 n=1 Tax=Dentiscutata heterogama TaxID=1316150 RepID=A0ACA9KJE4_9GLOM|nr:1160_t:CDS:2 [Dentiscutata heterogama]
MSEYSDFPSTREALKIIFSKASNEQISKYERQLARPLNFATNGLQNERRDENSRAIFHFTTNTELYTVRGNIGNLFPNAFMDQPSIQASIPNPRLHPIGKAWILTNIAKRKSDFGEDRRFFLSF